MPTVEGGLYETLINNGIYSNTDPKFLTIAAKQFGHSEVTEDEINELVKENKIKLKNEMKPKVAAKDTSSKSDTQDSQQHYKNRTDQDYSRTNKK